MSGNLLITIGVICGAISAFAIPYGFHLKSKEEPAVMEYVEGDKINVEGDYVKGDKIDVPHHFAVFLLCKEVAQTI